MSSRVHSDRTSPGEQARAHDLEGLRFLPPAEALESVMGNSWARAGIVQRASWVVAEVRRRHRPHFGLSCELDQLVERRADLHHGIVLTGSTWTAECKPVSRLREELCVVNALINELEAKLGIGGHQRA